MTERAVHLAAVGLLILTVALVALRGPAPSSDGPPEACPPGTVLVTRELGGWHCLDPR